MYIFVAGSGRTSYKLVVSQNGSNWKVGKFENVFPLFVTEIRPRNDVTKRIKVSLTINSKHPPILYVRTHSDKDDSDNESEPRHNYLNLNHDENEKSESNFEQFTYFLQTEEIVNFIGIGVENGHLEINSFSVEI
jgi:hypothetical protein